MNKADILIENGRVIDTANNIDEIKSIAIADGKIIKSDDITEAEQVVNADGCIVCPGLIDFHAHIGTVVAEMAINPMIIAFPNCVTTIVDAGSSGTAGFDALRAFSVIQPVRLKFMLHLSAEGNVTAAHPENQNPDFWDPKKIKKYVEKHSDLIVGIKVRLDNRILGGLGMKPLLEAVKIRDEIGCPLICHITNPPIPMDELVEYFRPGDVFTHVFHDVGYTALDEKGKVFDSIKKAQQNGVYFDASNGRRNFGTKVAKAAIKQGFLPDILSTDITAATAYVDNKNVVSLPFIMSKYLALGMSLNDVIKRVTEIPAKVMKMSGVIGCLSEGSCADVAILRPTNRHQIFLDQLGDEVVGDTLLKPEMTVREGFCVYRQIDFY